MKSLLEQALKVCDSAEVYCREVYNTSLSIVAGNMQAIESNKKTEVSLRIVKDGNLGSAVSTQLDDETLISRALISLENQLSEASPFPNETMAEVYSSSEELQKMTTEELVAFCFEVSNRLKSAAPEIISSVWMNRELRTVRLINSSGFESSYDYTNCDVGICTLTDQGFYGSLKTYNGGRLPNVRDKDIEKLVYMHRLEANTVTLDNEKMPVVFSGYAMGSLMLRVLSGVNGGNVVKDISPVKGKIGQQLFSEKISIMDDGAMPFGSNTCRFDDEGTRTRCTVLYDKGVLSNYLLTIGQAKKLDMKPTGNAIKQTMFSKEIEDSPILFNTNLKIEGESVPDDELIKGIKRGVYIGFVMGAHTGNINQGEFSLNIGCGYLIEDGKLVGKVKGGMVAGNVYDLFKHVEAIGSEYEPMNGIFYPIGYSPMVLFSEANIIGK